jgi:hypothetical protein
VARRAYGLIMLLLLALTAIAGCAAPGGRAGVRLGEPITHVQADLGPPDVISDRSGDLQRFYTPHSRPPAEWPWSAPRTFYYFGRDLQVTFGRGRVVSVRRIDARLRPVVDDVLSRRRPPEQAVR